MEAVQTILEVSTVLVQMDFYKEKVLNNVQHAKVDSDQEHLIELLIWEK